MILESRAMGRELLLEELESSGVVIRLDIETLLDMIYGSRTWKVHTMIERMRGR